MDRKVYQRVRGSLDDYRIENSETGNMHLPVNYWSVPSLDYWDYVSPISAGLFERNRRVMSH